MTDFSCRICGCTDNDFLISLGHPYQSGFTDDITKEFPRSGLALVRCTKCELTQLLENPELDTMYREYWYRSGLNSSMVNDLKDIVESIEERIVLKDRDVVIDIGMNDGTLFDFYHNDLIKIGYDPALNVGNSLEKCNHFVNDYFPSKDNPEILEFVKPKVITAIAMFYDLPDPNKFVSEVKSLLADDGLFVVQFTDLKSMFELTAFDNICSEHLVYYRLLDLNLLFQKHGLVIVDLEYNNVNGGSLRVYVKHSDALVEDDFSGQIRVHKAIQEESEALYSLWYVDFEHKINGVILEINKLFKLTKKYKKRVCGLGASTKGNTLLQVCQLTNMNLESIGEINPDKYGLFTVGSWIPIISEKELMENPPDILFILPWHFKTGFLRNFKDYMKDGGKLIFPLPRPIVYYYEEHKLKWMYLSSLQVS